MTGAGDFSGTIAPGRYRIVRPLAAGGRVHEARHEQLPARLAVKLYADVDARAFRRGAQAAVALRHDALVNVVDYGAALGSSFIVMEWVAGRALDVMLAEGGPLAPADVARLVDAVALGLQAAHRQGLSHGHLSPQRVLLLEDERTKLLGFGLDPAELRVSALGAALDTPYTAPERHAGGASALADQFSLGALAYELLTGVAPRGDLATRRPPRSVREYDPTIGVEVDEAIQRALYFDPRARWADVHTFAQRLREAADSDGTREERTRLAPLPLTVSRSAALPAVSASIRSSSGAPAIYQASSDTPTPIHIAPVIASVDVDLRTPAPRRIAPSLQGAPAMNPPYRPAPPPHVPSAPHGLPISASRPAGTPYQTSAPRASAPAHLLLNPTPTFSFADEPAPGPLYKPRRRSGGRFVLALLMLAAGAGGYLAVDSNGREQLQPYLKRAVELARSLKTLAPGASPETAAAPAEPKAAAPIPAEPPAPTVRPEVVPIPPAPAPARAADATAHATKVHHAAKHAPVAKARPTGKTSAALSDEAATEEALLAGPSGGR